MITALTHEQVMHYWETTFKDVFLNMAPGHIEVSQQYLNNILQQILMDKLQVWVVQNEEKEVLLALSTQYIYDQLADEKMMLIFSMYAFMPTPDMYYASSLDKLRDVARANGCTKIIAYTMEPRALELAMLLGGKASTQVIFSL